MNTLLGPHRPLRLTATEGWAPNLDVARNALTPCGIDLARYDSEHDQRMPMQDESFDLVMARHESYNAEEVARVLRAGGIFLTQQVHGQDVPELYDWFGGEPGYPHVTLERTLDDARTAGLTGWLRFVVRVQLLPHPHEKTQPVPRVARHQPRAG
ncbi:MAG: class I SAM-dependent methyltransferase [Actinomycetota bacterium]|nr:class I SAM-dependent methyltransferase [Actinomycetota bacterium]